MASNDSKIRFAEIDFKFQNACGITVKGCRGNYARIFCMTALTTIEFAKDIHTFKRLADPEGIAKPVRYPASDAFRFTTGMALLAGGGVSICKT